MGKRLNFAPSSEELDYIYQNVDSWTEWCKTHLKNDMNNKREKKIENLLFRMTLLLGGLLIFSISFFVLNIFLFVVSVVIGSFVCIVASFSIYRVYKKHG